MFHFKVSTRVCHRRFESFRWPNSYLWPHHCGLRIALDLLRSWRPCLKAVPLGRPFGKAKAPGLAFTCAHVRLLPAKFHAWLSPTEFYQWKWLLTCSGVFKSFVIRCQNAGIFSIVKCAREILPTHDPWDRTGPESFSSSFLPLLSNSSQPFLLPRRAQ